MRFEYFNQLLSSVLAVILSNAPAFAALTNADVKTVLNNDNPTNTHLLKSFGSEARTSVGSKNFYRDLASSTVAPVDALHTAQEIVKRDQQLRTTSNVSSAVLGVGIDISKGAVSAGIVLAPETGGGSLMMSGVGYVASKTLQQVQDLVKTTAREDIRRNLKTNLEELRGKTSQAEYNKITSTQDPTQFKNAVEGRLGLITQDAFKDIPAEEQDQVNSMYVREIATVLKEGLGSLKDVQSLDEKEIVKNRKDIIALSRTFTKFAENNQKQLANIVETQTQIQGGLKQLDDRIGKTEAGVNFMQNYMFGKMSPQEQLTALEGGLFPGMPTEAKKTLEDEIKLVKQREDFSKQMASYLNGANELANIAKNVGVDPKVVNKMQKAASIGNAAFEAFTAFSSGNYLSGVSALSNILGFGGNRDIAGERHKEIMDALGSLYEQKCPSGPSSGRTAAGYVVF